MRLARIFDGDKPDRIVALGIASYRLTAVQQQLAGLSNPAGVTFTDHGIGRADVSLLVNELRTKTARISYLHGILQDANAALLDSMDEFTDLGQKILDVEENASSLQIEGAGLTATVAKLEESVSKLQLDRAKVIETVNRLEADLSDLETERTKLGTIILGLEKQLHAKSSELEQVRASRSWRMTAPIRAMVTFLQSFWRAGVQSSVFK